jgi:uncharacterized membrane protein YeiH
MVEFFARFGIKRTRRSLYALLTVLIAAVVIPGLGGMIFDRLLKEAPSVECGKELASVRSARSALTQKSVTESKQDLTEAWLGLRDRSVTLRRQCKEHAEHGPGAVEEDDRVRRSLAAYRVQQNL